MTKLKTYILTISVKFPDYHSKKGWLTYFFFSIVAKKKIHTIMSNYELWKKRMDSINAGKAILSIRQWSCDGSKQVEYFRYGKGEVGIQMLEKCSQGFVIDGVLREQLTTETLAKNEGLYEDDFLNWFDFSESKAIIHFSNFRY